VRVDLTVENGNVVELETFVGGRAPQPALTVSTRAAVDYLLALAERSGEPVGKHAILPALLADSVEPWPRLLQIAKNENAASQVRKSAIFWLGQAAGDKATQGLKSLLSDEDVEVKKSAVFALSQIRGEQSVTALIDVVRTSKDKEVRKSALFWLSQKNDPRVLALFEDILLKR
jgi:HEAT repeat protein